MINKRPTGHIAHLRIQFKLIAMYIKTFIKRRKTPNLLFENGMVLIYKTWVTFTQGSFVQSLVEIGRVVLET